MIYLENLLPLVLVLQDADLRGSDQGLFRYIFLRYTIWYNPIDDARASVQSPGFSLA